MESPPDQLKKTRPVVTKKQSSKKTKLNDLEDKNSDDDDDEEDKENAAEIEDLMHKPKKFKPNMSKVVTPEINDLDDL